MRFIYVLSLYVWSKISKDWIAPPCLEDRIALYKSVLKDYLMDNPETKDGLEFPYIPRTKGIPLVCDMTSNFATRNFDIYKFGVVFGRISPQF